MRRTALIVICCCVFTTQLLAQQKTTATLDEAAVRSLIRQLDDRESSKREAAENALRELGPVVLDYLPAVSDRTGGELKGRLLRIREHLEKLRVAETTEATRLTMKGKMKLSEALESVEKQTGNVVLDSRRNQGVDPEFEIDVEDEPFWVAFDKVCDAAGITVSPYVGESRKIAIVNMAENANPRVGRATYEGLFRISPTSISCERNLGDDSGNITRLTLELLWEPRVVPILIRQNLQNVAVVTDSDETLSLLQSGTIQIPIQPTVASLDLRLPIELPSRDATSIKSLKGELVALVPGGDVTFEFKDLVDLSDAKQSRGGLMVSIEEIRRNGDLRLPQIAVRIRFDQASESMQSHLDWVENNIISLVDPNGNPADEPNYERYLERDSEIGFRYVFPVETKDLKGWTLTYTTPAGVSEIPVSYEINDIPLP